MIGHSNALDAYLHHPALPYLAPPSWLRTAATAAETKGVLALAEDETGNPLRKTLILLPGEHDRWSHDIVTLTGVLGPQPPRTRLVVMETTAMTRYLTDAGPSLAWQTESDWYGMARDVHDPGPGDRAVSLARLPGLIPAAFRLWNRGGFAVPIGEDAALQLAAQHPLWLAENTYVVVSPEGREIVASARLHLEQRADGQRFGFLRGLITDPEVRSTSSLRMLLALYGALMDRLRAEGVPRCCLKVAVQNQQLRQFYELLGFGTESRVQELSAPVSVAETSQEG